MGALAKNIGHALHYRTCQDARSTAIFRNNPGKWYKNVSFTVTTVLINILITTLLDTRTVPITKLSHFL